MFYIEEFLKHLKEKQYSFSTLKAYHQPLDPFEDYYNRTGMTRIR